MKDDRLKNYLPPALVFAATFAVYLYTLCPTVYWDDAGELIAACYTLGIPHPPGHPLYAIVGKLFTLIPIGSPAMRVNLMSAFFGALTCSVLFQLVRELIERDEEIRRFAVFGGVISALGAGSSLILWNQSVLAETTTLHTFFMLIVTLIAFRIDADDETDEDDARLTKRLLAFSFIYGLSFTNHVAGLFFAPSLGFILLFRLRSRLFRPRRLVAMAALFALGLSVYAYLPVASRFNPAVDWGNPETAENFWWVVSARQYSGSLVSAPDLSSMARGAGNVLSTFFSNLGILGCLFAVVGCVRLWLKRKQVIIYGLLIVLILYATSLNSAFIFVYMLPAVLMLAIWAGYGVGALCDRAERTAAKMGGISARLISKSAHAAGILLVAVLLVGHFNECNMRDYTHARDYGIELLGSLPPDAVLITGTADPLFIAWYLQYCEDFRPDVKVITRNALRRPGYMDQIRRQYPELKMPSQFQQENNAGVLPADINTRGGGLPRYANSYFEEFYELNFADFPIFWEGIEANQLLVERFEPCGLVFRINPSGKEAGSECPEPPDSRGIAEKIDHDPAAGKIYGNHLFNYGLFHQRHGDVAMAAGYYEDALLLRPDDARPLNNIGAMLGEQGRFDEAFGKFREAFRADPANVTSNRNMGRMLFDRGEAEEAAPYFRRAIKLDPANFDDYYDLGLCYITMGKNRRAIEILVKALEIKPDSPEALSSLGALYLSLDETQNAEKLLNAAVQIGPDNVDNWYNLACLRAMEGDESGAAKNLEKAIRLDRERVYRMGSKDQRIASILDALEGTR